MSGVPIGYSTAVGMGSGCYDAVQTRLGANRPDLSSLSSFARAFTSRILTAGAVWGIPIYLKGKKIGYPYMSYINPTLRWRMVASIVVNGGSALRYGSASCYHAYKREDTEAKDHFKTACKFFWRLGLDASLLHFAPVKALEYAMIAEAVANFCMPNMLRNKLKEFNTFIDNKIIGKTSKEEKLLETEGKLLKTEEKLLEAKARIRFIEKKARILNKQRHGGKTSRKIGNYRCTRPRFVK